jgi:quinol monooxygenase YgiN
VTYGLCGTIVATPGNGETLADHLLEAAAALADVTACQLYTVSRDTTNPDAIWVHEVWTDAEAHRASLDLESVQQLITRARPLIAEMGPRFELEPLGGKGLPAQR